jgi:hypothetical protein
LLEYILSLKTENWSTVLGSNFPSNLVTLLEAFIHKKVEKHSYYFSGNEGEKYSDSFYLSNRGIKKLSEIGLITEKFYENIKSYPYPHADNFSYKKDTYEVKCTPKGKKVAKEIIEELFHNNSNLKSILANLEIEDFPKQDFPYENPSYWGFPRLTAVFEKKKWVMERDLELTTEDWWTDNLGYLKKVID